MESVYQPNIIEANAQAFWEKEMCFQVTEDLNKEKFYCLSMFPYPSGQLHMGHVRNYTLSDVIARQQRMLGKNVLQPIGWDAFGLPAENAAIQHKVAPAEWTYKNVAYMRKQMMRLGFAYDWTREITTCDPNYYHWEQWFFLQLYKKGLVYKKNAEVNWDPVDQTVLANEQVVDGRGWRSGALVERRAIPQWFFKITDYAEELLTGLDHLPHWPEQVKTMQRNWIGRSFGVEIQFPVKDQADALSIFTTRPDTLWGVTYIAIAPQHPLAKAAALLDPNLKPFLDECRLGKMAEADMATLEKRGRKTPFIAIHPFTKEPLPIWIANFVMMEYGSGAIMGVPAHDERDFEFAKQYTLPIQPVIEPFKETVWDFSKAAYTGQGKLIQSKQFTGLSSDEASKAIIDELVKQKIGVRKTHYRLRDWSISRQRYWGTPIPMIECDQCGTVPVPEGTLPVILPTDIEVSGVTSPLKTLPAFYETICPLCQQKARRETDTFDTFFESSWYYARFACKKQEHAMLDGRANYWLPIDQYIGGIEHAVMHLLYARFIHKAMRDEGLVNTNEPFTALLTQGMVLNQGLKMSKSKGNTVDPKPLIDHYGTDTLRLFVMFAAPPEQSLEWSDAGVEGAHRFLKKLWRFGFDNREIILAQNQMIEDIQSIQWDESSSGQKAIFHEFYEIVDQIKYDYDRLQFNTVVSGCMKLFNLLLKSADTTFIYYGFSVLLRLMTPITPHITHQLWEDLRFPGLLLDAPWPKSHLNLFKKEEMELVVQINGKLRTKITVPANASPHAIEEIAKKDTKVQHSLLEKQIKKMITVPGKLINIVTEK